MLQRTVQFRLSKSIVFYLLEIKLALKINVFGIVFVVLKSDSVLGKVNFNVKLYHGLDY